MSHMTAFLIGRFFGLVSDCRARDTPDIAVVAARAAPSFITSRRLGCIIAVPGIGEVIANLTQDGGHSNSRLAHLRQGFGVGGGCYAVFGDDGGDQVGGGDVEGGVEDIDVFGGGYFAQCRERLRWRRVAQWGFGAGLGRREIDAADGRGDEEGDFVVAGEDGDAERADFVGDIAIGGDAVGADDDGVDLALLHDSGGHAVADDGHGDTVLLKLEGGDPAALQQRAGFIGKDVE